MQPQARPSRRRCSGCPWPEPSCSEGKPLGETPPGRPRRRSRHGCRRVARCPGAGHWSVAPSSHSVHRWQSMGRLSYRSPRALAPHRLVEADTCEQRARHAHSRRRRRRPMTPAAETNRRAALHRGAQPVEDLARSAAGRIAAARPQLLPHGGVAPSGGSAGGPREREPASRERQRASRIALGHETAARRERGPGHRSVRQLGRRAPSRPDASVPKDVRTPSPARICHSTERSIVGITTSGGSSMLPTRAGCQHHQPERFQARARAHVRVQRSFGPTHLCAGARGGIITQPLSAST